MSKLEVIQTITVAKYYIPCLFYGDTSGIEGQEELKKVLEMIERIGTKTIDVIEDSEDFSRCNISGFYSDTIQINILDWV